MKVNLKQGGFSAVHTLLVFVIVAILGFAGWRVYEARKEADKSLTNTTNASDVEKPETQKKAAVDEEALTWKHVTSRQGGFSVRIPDGWEIYNYALSDNIRSEKLTHKPGIPAKVEALEYAYAGDSTPRLSIRLLTAEQYHNLDGDEAKTEFKTEHLEGARYYKKYPVQPIEGIGPYPGMEAYTYELKSDGKTLYVFYNIFNDNQYVRQILNNFTEGDRHQVELIERMIRTIELK